jgi:spore maturation protein CgeB
MSGLARSEITLNFSRANMVDVQQLKTRLLEASFVGCLVATDDADLSDRYFTEGQDFVRFRSVPDAADVVRPLLADRERLRRMQQAARLRARDIAETVFWERVDAGLATSGLPTVARREDL